MDGEMLRKNLKAIYKDANAPEGFSSRVMIRIKSQTLDSPSKDISLRFKRVSRPALAIAACFVLLLGMYLAGSGLPGAAPTEGLRTDETPVEDEPMADVQIDDEAPYINGDRPVLMAEAKEEPLHLPPLVKEPAVNDLHIAQNGQQDDPPNDTLESDAPLSRPSDNVRMITVSGVNGGAVLEPPSVRQPESAAVSGKLVEIVPLAEEVSLVLSEADIPHPAVFIRRARVIDSVALNVSVGTINNALRKIDERERLFGVSADTEATELRADGTIVVMRSYVLPNAIANAFVTNVSAIGSSDGIKRNRVDITKDYNRMLDIHRDFLLNLAGTGQGMRDLNEIAGKLVYLDKRAQDGVKNVVVWLEDRVDF